MSKLRTAGMRLVLAISGEGIPSLERFKREEGQTFVEYALILALISVALTAALLTLQGKIQGIFDAISADL